MSRRTGLVVSIAMGALIGGAVVAVATMHKAEPQPKPSRSAMDTAAQEALARLARSQAGTIAALEQEVRKLRSQSEKVNPGAPANPASASAANGEGEVPRSEVERVAAQHQTLTKMAPRMVQSLATKHRLAPWQLERAQRILLGYQSKAFELQDSLVKLPEAEREPAKNQQQEELRRLSEVARKDLESFLERAPSREFYALSQAISGRMAGQVHLLGQTRL